MAKLTKGQIEGIRLIADLFVIDDIIKNVFNKDPKLAPYSEELRKHLQNKVLMPFKAQEELQRQIKIVRREWLERLLNDPEWQEGAA